MALEIKRIVNEPMGSNCYILYNLEHSKRCLMIDPGGSNMEDYIDFMSALNLTPEWIILTHEHHDHCWSVNMLKEQYCDLKVLCSSICSERMGRATKNLSAFDERCKPFVVAPADRIIDEGVFEWNGYSFEIVPTPGHTASSISIIVGKNIFTGDEWIKDTPTFTKFPTGSAEQQVSTEAYLHSLHGFTAYGGHGDFFEIK